MNKKAKKGFPAKKYFFEALEMWESTEVVGSYLRLYNNCFAIGQRKGIWLKCEKIDNGARITRVPSSPYKPRIDKNKDVKEQLKDLKDALRFISIIVIRIDKKLNELTYLPNEEHQHRAVMKDTQVTASHAYNKPK